MTIPCASCLTLGICRHKGIHTGGVSALAMKCSLLDEFMLQSKEDHDWNPELMYDAYDFFKRRWKELL